MIGAQLSSRLQNSTLQLTARQIRRSLALLVLLLACAFAAQAQTFTVLHSFTGGGDGSSPVSGLTMDHGGNLYGTTTFGGLGPGTVFEIAERNSNWILSTLHDFLAGNDGCDPMHANLAIASDGTLYGTAPLCGGNMPCTGTGCGIVFRLRPSPDVSATLIAPWNENILYHFRDVIEPDASGKLAFDPTGNIFGTTRVGGIPGRGYVYELSPSGSGYVETTLYTFQDMSQPSGVILDNSGNMYGVTRGGRNSDRGDVFELSWSGSQWVATSLYAFRNQEDGEFPVGDLITDAQGNLYGTTSAGGTGGGGTVFEMSPDGHGGWIYITLADLAGFGDDSGGPQDALTMDSAGNLYGTAVLNGAFHKGNVFKLTNNGGSWTYTTLHDFTGGSDGALPFSNAVVDAQGNLYGTASEGGDNSTGVVWKIVQ
jgi:uncharacterized repeat protein (TIGR03803 family)